MDMELSEGIEEPQRGGILQSTSKRVRMIFSVMASPNRIDILRILNSKGPLTYSELKSLAGFKSKNLLDSSPKKKVANLHTILENY
jgi:ribonucleoside-triphosphate reductase